MMKKNLSWNHYKAFFEVLRLGSLSAAARQMGVRQSTIGRQIESLEEELGVPLFVRSQVGLKPTDTALRLRPHLEALNVTTEALLRDAQLEDTGTSGTIRLTTSEAISTDLLPKVLFKLREKFPLMRFEISISNDFENLLAREADIAIRTVNFEQKAIVTKKAGELQLGLFANSIYMHGRKTPQKVSDLKDHSMIGYDEENERIRRLKKLIPSFDREDFMYRTDNVSFHTSLIDAGCGIGLTRVLPKHPDRIRILAKEYDLKLGIWVAMHEDLKANKKYRSVFNEITSALKDYLAN